MLCYTSFTWTKGIPRTWQRRCQASVLVLPAEWRGPQLRISLPPMLSGAWLPSVSGDLDALQELHIPPLFPSWRFDSENFGSIHVINQRSSVSSLILDDISSCGLQFSTKAKCISMLVMHWMKWKSWQHWSQGQNYLASVDIPVTQRWI